MALAIVVQVSTASIMLYRRDTQYKKNALTKFLSKSIVGNGATVNGAGGDGVDNNGCSEYTKMFKSTMNIIKISPLGAQTAYNV